MSLKLQKTVRGITCEYWKLIQTQTDYANDTTRSILGLYIDREHRDRDIKGFQDRKAMEMDNTEIEAETQKILDEMKEPIDAKKLENARKKAHYLIWKKPKKEQHPTGEKDVEGKPIMEEVETNEFFSASDI